MVQITTKYICLDQRFFFIKTVLLEDIVVCPVLMKKKLFECKYSEQMDKYRTYGVL